MMERRDILKDEIEAMARALGKLLARILGTEITDKGNPGLVAEISETFNTELNIDIDTLLTIPPDEIKPYLKARNFQPANLDNLSEILLETGKRIELQDAVKARLFYSRTLDLYRLMDQIYETASLDRYQKEAWIQARLNN